MRENFNGMSTQTLQKLVHLHEETEFEFVAYRLQFIKTYQFLELNEEGFNNFSLMKSILPIEKNRKLKKL